jgi:hypothetical protein
MIGTEKILLAAAFLVAVGINAAKFLGPLWTSG